MPLTRADIPAMEEGRPFELPQEYTQLAGTPGVGVVGNRAYRVGVQQWSPEQAAAFEQRRESARRAAAAEMQSYREQQQEQWLLDQVRQTGKVDQQLKLIEQSHQFLKRLAMDRRVRQLTDANVPADQAIRQAVVENMGALSPAGISTFMKASQRPNPAFVPREEVMGGVPGVRHGRYGESWTPIRPPSTGLSTADRALLQMELQSLNKEIKDAEGAEYMEAGPEKDAAVATLSEAKARRDQIQSQLREENIASADRRGTAAPIAAPGPAAGGIQPHYTWDPQNKLRRIR